MDEREFRAAFDPVFPEPTVEELIDRFQRAFEATRGDTQTAMAVVNEVLSEPLVYEQLLTLMRAED